MATQTQEIETAETSQDDGFNTMAEALQREMNQVVIPDTKPMPEPKLELKVDPSLPKKEEPKPAAKTEVKPPEKPAVVEEIPKGMSAAAGEHFSKIKKQRDEFKEKLEKREKELLEEIEKVKKTVSTTPAIDPEIERIKKEHQEFSEIVKMKYVEESSQFKNHFDGLMNSAIEGAKQAVGIENEAAVVELINLPNGKYKDEQIEQFYLGLSERQRIRLESAIEKYDGVSKERASAIADKSSYDQLKQFEAKEKENQAASQKQRVQSILSNALTAAKEMEAFKPREGDDAHNAAIPVREEFIKAAFEGRLTEQQFYGLPLIAAEGMFLKEKELPALREKIAKLESEIAGRTAAVPSLGEDGKPSKTTETATQGKDFAQIFKENWTGQ